MIIANKNMRLIQVPCRGISVESVAKWHEELRVHCLVASLLRSVLRGGGIDLFGGALLFLCGDEAYDG